MLECNDKYGIQCSYCSEFVLEEHDKRIIADERTKMEAMLSELPTVNGYIDSAYLWLKWEQLKEQSDEHM